MDFCDKQRVRDMLQDKIVAIVGSGPGSLSNPAGFVDSHEVVIRVNNYKTMGGTGRRTDIFYSFFGVSVKKSAIGLKQDGVKLCMAKCPNSKFMESAWHRDNGAMNGVDFRSIYERRKPWWFCDTYVPTTREFVKNFKLLGGHVPTTGFSALLDVLSYNPAHVYLTGFDFFASQIHNLNERWKPVNKSDPIGHVPEVEAQWLADNLHKLPVSFDKRLKATLDKLARPE
jgi:hypothetical protein